MALGAKLVVRSRSKGHGAVNDVRVVAPSGAVAADFGTKRTRGGARVVVPADETGVWRIELQPRNGTSGRYALRAGFRRPRR